MKYLIVPCLPFAVMSFGIDTRQQFDAAFRIVQTCVALLEVANPFLVAGQRVTESELTLLQLADNRLQLLQPMLEGYFAGG